MAQRDQGGSARKSRKSRYGLARGVTLIWLAMVFVLFDKGGFEGAFSPLLLLAGTVLVPFVWWRTIRDHRAERASENKVQELPALSSEGFRDWVAARFRDLGYEVSAVDAPEEERVDLVARKPDETVIVRCHDDRSQIVEEPDLKELYGAMKQFDANYAYFVTAGRPTRSAAEWTIGKPIEIWGRDHLALLSEQTPPAGSPTG